MLTKLYRYGPARQRILRGFVIAPGHADCTAARVVDAVEPFSLGEIDGRQVEVRIDPDYPSAVLIDTDMIWLHTAEAREARFKELAEATRRLARIVSDLEGTLLPSAVQHRPSETWAKSVCGDRHILSTHSEIEKEICVNLLRENSPTLIALTGRAAANRNGVEKGGSRRLGDSNLHFPARNFASVSGKYPKSLSSELVRNEGIESLAHLDVNPFVENDDSAVEVRFVDGQWLTASVRAVAILLQALSMAAGRMAYRGERLPGDRQSNEPFPGEPTLPDAALESGDADQLAEFSKRASPRIEVASQAELDRNRQRAIEQGLEAEFEFGSRAGADGQQHPLRSVKATAMVVRLFDQLLREFQALEVQEHEIAPLIIGSTLVEANSDAIKCENDLLQWRIEQDPEWRQGDFLSNLQREMFSPPGDVDPLTAENQRFGRFTEWIAKMWESNLHVPPSFPTPDSAVDS